MIKNEYKLKKFKVLIFEQKCRSKQNFYVLLFSNPNTHMIIMSNCSLRYKNNVCLL